MASITNYKEKKMSPTEIIEKQRRKIRWGKTYSIATKFIAGCYLIAMNYHLVINDQFTLESAIAACVVAGFISGSALPIDISKIINNIKGDK